MLLPFLRARAVLIGAFAAALLVDGFVLARRLWPPPEETPAQRGLRIAERVGCFACHGPGGTRGQPDPGTPGATVPRWDGGVIDGYVRSDAELREWLELGLPKRLAALPEETRQRSLVPMPGYAERLTPAELNDVMAYLRAVTGWADELPDAAYEGRAIATRLGCFGCHGPSGMGGVQNPGSYTGQIPAWDGPHFPELVRDDAELRAWILDGRPRRLADDPLARRFLDGQLLQMPAYGPYLSDDELQRLVDYVNWLRKERK